jgi:hypothetical protein
MSFVADSDPSHNIFLMNSRRAPTPPWASDRRLAPMIWIKAEAGSEIENREFVQELLMKMMKAAVLVEPGRVVLDDKPVPEIGPLARGLIIGHEPVGARHPSLQARRHRGCVRTFRSSAQRRAEGRDHAVKRVSDGRN